MTMTPPVRVRPGQGEAELYNTDVLLQLAVHEAVEIVGDVGSPDVHLHTDRYAISNTDNENLSYTREM